MHVIFCSLNEVKSAGQEVANVLNTEFSRVLQAGMRTRTEKRSNLPCTRFSHVHFRNVGSRQHGSLHHWVPSEMSVSHWAIIGIILSSLEFEHQI